MSHLDTAYQLGVKQAEEDFKAELQKAAQGAVAAGTATPPPRQPGSAVPGAPTVPTPINPQVGGGIHNQAPAPVMPQQRRTPA